MFFAKITKLSFSVITVNLLMYMVNIMSTKNKCSSRHGQIDMDIPIDSYSFERQILVKCTFPWN